jgi:hypothetical protein
MARTINIAIIGRIGTINAIITKRVIIAIGLL